MRARLFLLCAAPALAAGCNVIFGISAGSRAEGSGGEATTSTVSATSTSTSSSTGSVSSSSSSSSGTAGSGGTGGSASSSSSSTSGGGTGGGLPVLLCGDASKSCAPGELCCLPDNHDCYASPQPSCGVCAMPAAGCPADHAAPFECQKQSDCPAGMICCGDVNPGDWYNKISCETVCPQDGSHVALCNDGICPAGTGSCHESELGPWMHYCL